MLGDLVDILVGSHPFATLERDVEGALRREAAHERDVLQAINVLP